MPTLTIVIAVLLLGGLPLAGDAYAEGGSAAPDEGENPFPWAMAGKGSALAADLDIDAYHGKFIDAFNGRQWQDVEALLAPDIVFHRASGEEVFIGPDAVVGRFESTIGAPDQWNVKFAKLDTDGQLTGAKGGVVERGAFAVTAGADDSACYAGSYMMTWSPQDDDSWRLRLLAWQDLEADIAECK